LATVENISLRCRRHKQYEAELAFGPRRGSTVRGAVISGVAPGVTSTPVSNDSTSG
jgi:hypothetical protein